MVEEAGEGYQPESPSIIDRFTGGIEEAGEVLKEGASLFREKTSELLDVFRNRSENE
ncbi:MAG: hypothetical protein U5K84_02025 [Alkalibacterium sp.]|nr:hypothetical protein [Alkalibacterium sp.]